MPYPEAKIYKDGISYIAIPHTTRPKRPRRKRVEEVVTVTEEIETDSFEQETAKNTEVEEEPVQAENVKEKPKETVKIERQMTKRERFDELYQKYIEPFFLCI